MSYLPRSILICCLLLSSVNAFSNLHTTNIIKANRINNLARTFLNAQTESTFDAEADEALIRRISADVMRDSGVELDQLINPSKVVNLERELVQLARELENSKSAAERKEIEQKMQKKQSTLNIEKRSVMQGWLKSLFVGQSVLAGFVSLGMVYNSIPGFDLDLPFRVLGFWMWWLFIIPSLRARKPVAEEKEALNLAFLGSPLISIAMPFVTKDVAIIWWANAVVMGMCYAYSYSKPKDLDSEGEEKSVLPPALIKAFKALDYGSGQERGLRK